MSTKRKVCNRAAAMGAVVHVVSSGRDELEVEVSAPSRTVFSGSGVHALVASQDFDEAGAVWSYLLDGMADGVRPCVAVGCDICEVTP